ncbi:MAG: hypothetical protein ACE5FS_14740 [Paracoccaceae bacterium]
MNWTEEEDAILRDDWPKGGPAQKIALAVNRVSLVKRTKGAVLRRVAMLGLKRDTRVVSTAPYQPRIINLGNDPFEGVDFSSMDIVPPESETRGRMPLPPVGLERGESGS